MKRFSLSGVLSLLLTVLGAQQITHHTVYFDFDKHDLSPQAEDALRRLATELEGLPDYAVALEAHTDDRGSGAYNDGLARRRADAVEDYLTGLGIMVDKIDVEVYGEDRPAYANDFEESRQLNRRVDLHVSSWRYGSLDELWGRLSDGEGQRFLIDPRRNTRLNGEQGTAVWIPAGSFALPDGSAPETEVEIVLEEAYGMGDMLLKGLHTSAGDRLLETGGMIYIGAVADGQPLQLKDGAGLTVGLPTAERLEGMELFRGTTDAGGKLVDWEAEGQPFSADPAMLRMPPRPVMPVMRHYIPEFKADRSGEPEAPERPARPFKPHEPRRESFKYNPGFFKGLLIGKEEKNRIEEERYQQALEDYLERKARYEARLVGYEAAMERYRADLRAYEEALASWKEGLEEQQRNWSESPAYQSAQQHSREAYERQLALYRDSMDLWEARRQELLAGFENDYEVKGRLDAASFNRYFYQVNTMGWINCDRFYDLPEEEKLALVIQDPDRSDERVFVVFEEQKSMVNAYRRDQRYISGSLPRDARVKVIAVKVEGGRPRLAVHRVVVAETENTPLQLQFKPCRLSDIREELAGL